MITSKRVLVCSVPECTNTEAKRHFFPKKDERIRKIWLRRINNPIFIDKPSSYITAKAVCGIHFEEICKREDGKLKNYSLPTLYIPGFAGVDDEKERCFSFPPNMYEMKGTPPKVKRLMESFKNRIKKRRLIEDEIQPVRKPEPLDNLEEAGLSHEDDDPQTSVISEEAGLSHEDDDPQTSVISEEAGLSHEDDDPQTSVISEEAGLSHEDDDPQTSVISEEVGLSHEDDDPQTSVISEEAGSSYPVRIAGRTRTVYRSNEMKNLQKLLSKTKIKNATLHSKVKFLSKNLYSFEKALPLLNETTNIFLKSQIKNQVRKKHAKRYTAGDKALALALYKRTGKGYRYLSNLFSLPSKRTLNRTLSHIPFGCGINKVVFQHLHTEVNKLTELDKYCVLMFDEMSINMGLHYNSSDDYVDGFVDFGGSDRRAQFADHALVFLIKGVRRKWKQVVCVAFCRSSTPAPVLCNLIKNIVRQLRDVGLTVLATICDQGSTNQSAIKTLIRDTNEYCLRNNFDNRYHGYLVDDEQVYHIYDCPHLLKNIRNNLLSKDLHFEMNNIAKTATWEHVMRLYVIDSAQGEFSQFQKLTDEHVLPDKIKKMKVKNCTQVFSATVAAAMHSRAKTASELPSSSKFFIDPRATETADLLLFFDKLFDSVNASLLSPPPWKPLRGVVRNNSPHVSFWQSSIPILRSLYYTVPPTSNPIVVPSIKNWIYTVQSFLYIWKFLQTKGFRFMSTRVFNQDPLENFFSCIRSCGARNVNPSCSSFLTSVKTLILNNLSSPHSVGANCEEDESEGPLDNLKLFITRKIEEDLHPVVAQPVYPLHSAHINDSKWDFATPYVAGAVIRKIRSKLKCRNCINKMCASTSVKENLLIETREYNTGKLMHPSSLYIKTFNETCNKIISLLPRHILSYNVKKTILGLLDKDHLLALFCSKHSGQTEFFLNCTFNLVFYNYLNRINKILRGKDLRHKDRDALHTMAYECYQKKYFNRRN